MSRASSLPVSHVWGIGPFYPSCFTLTIGFETQLLLLGPIDGQMRPPSVGPCATEAASADRGKRACSTLGGEIW